MPAEADITIAPVRYRDGYRHDYSEHRLMRFVTKRRAFEHEREVRAIVYDKAAGERGELGILVPVSIPTLIHKIVVSPFAPAWLSAVVADTVNGSTPP